MFSITFLYNVSYLFTYAATRRRRLFRPLDTYRPPTQGEEAESVSRSEHGAMDVISPQLRNMHAA